MEGRISRQRVAKVLRFNFEQDMKIQVLDMTPCLCASGLGAYTTTQTDGWSDGRTERKALQLFTTSAVITALKYNKHPSLDSADAFNTYTLCLFKALLLCVQLSIQICHLNHIYFFKKLVTSDSVYDPVAGL
jgi:hypothetical protein